nr:helix-turn-helix domain-containing protein [Streptomyces scopuliridis]
MVLLSAQGLPVAKIAEVSFTSDDRVRDVSHNFNTDGFDSLYPKYPGGRPKTFTLPERREIKKIAKSKPTEHDLPFSTWSLTKLADFLVAEGVVDDISHEGLRILLREEGVSFQCLKTWKTSRDPDYAAKKARVEHLYAIADGEVIPEDGEPEVIFRLDEFGPLNLMPHPGAGNGPNAAVSTRTPTVNHAGGDEPSTTATAGYGTCSPPWTWPTWPRTSSTDTSSRSSGPPNSWSSAATCAPSTRRRYGLRLSATIFPHI